MKNRGYVGLNLQQPCPFNNRCVASCILLVNVIIPSFVPNIKFPHTFGK